LHTFLQQSFMGLSGEKIVLGVTGSIAAYKTPQLVRLLVKAGAEVQVLMTPAAAAFVSPLVLSTVSGKPVLRDVIDGDSWNNHVAAGLWADAMVIAPCSANTLAKLAHGLCDTVVNAVYLSARCPVFIAPAMDEDMWRHPSTRQNVETLRSYGNRLIPVGYGELASGLTGEGRMAEPEEILEFLAQSLGKAGPMAGKKALVTAGPTFERLDPVRFIGNFSTGKMGIAIAEALAAQGAEVQLVLGPTHLETRAPGITTTRVESAQEMYEACAQAFPRVDIAVMAAAVADFRPKEQAAEKIKKHDAALSLSLVKNPDILAALGGMKQSHQLLAGFALETTQELAHAREKLEAKNADIIVLNSLQDAGAGFGHDTNKITILNRNGDQVALPLQSKQEAAAAIVRYMLELKNA
jgi:phosphopantothenoylcysteine decarboxylase/phosphopantothenate--cysteine ligase